MKLVVNTGHRIGMAIIRGLDEVEEVEWTGEKGESCRTNYG